VLNSIANSSKITSVPSDLTPPLVTFASSSQAKAVSGVSYFNACDAYDNPAEDVYPSPCIMGETSSTKTVVLVGDSNVGNWAPALDIGLKSAGYRLAVFGFAGCPASDLVYTSYANLTSTQVSQCNEWHIASPKAISALDPVAVIVVAGAADLHGITDQKWIGGFAKLFTAATVGSPSSVRILLGTSPFPGPTPTCLAAHPNPQDCALGLGTTSGAQYVGYLARDRAIAFASGAKLIPTSQWFCHLGTCSPIVSKYLVFADTDHVTTAYSQFLSPVVTPAVTSLIPGA
jgi:hypothetical protein